MLTFVNIQSHVNITGGTSNACIRKILWLYLCGEWGSEYYDYSEPCSFRQGIRQMLAYARISA